MRASPFTHNFLLLFSGPLIWAVHFVAIYAFTGVVCARAGTIQAWLDMHVALWAIAGASVFALAAIAAINLGIRPRDAAPDNHRFIRWMSITLGLLSAIAIVWETLPAFLVPVCG